MLVNSMSRHQAVKGTALSFAVVGTIMHGLNLIHAMNSAMSQAWSIVAIIGFVATATQFMNTRSLLEKSKLSRTGRPSGYLHGKIADNKDIALP